jgi:hypothetical protein
VRVDHDPQRELLQVQQLRYDIRLCLMSSMRSVSPERLYAVP